MFDPNLCALFRKIDENVKTLMLFRSLLAWA